MSDDPIPYTPTDKAALMAKQLRIDDLEHMLRHFDRTSMHLLHYVRSVEGLPDAGTWRMVVEQVEEMTDPYGPRNPNR